MKRLMVLVAAGLAGCSFSAADDEALLAQQGLEAQSNAVFASVEKHATCAGFHRAHAAQATNKKNEIDYHKTAETNAVITATEIATSEVSNDLASEMVEQLTKTQASEWAYTIESNSKPELVLAQASSCEAMAQEQKNVVRDIVKAKYGFKKPQ